MTGPMTDHAMEQEAPPRPAVRVPVHVMFFDTDCAGVVHNIAYLRFIEVARTLLAEQLGMALADMTKVGEYPVVVRTEIDYRRPAALADRLLVHGWLDAIARGRFWCGFEILKEGAPGALVRCRQTLALVRVPPGKPLPLPASWKERFGHLRPVVAAASAAAAVGPAGTGRTEEASC